MSTVGALLVLVLLGIYVGLWLQALVQLGRSHLPAVEKVLWVGVLLVFPVLGLIAWWIVRPVQAPRPL